MPVATTRPLVPGVWAPIPTFFDANEEIGELTFRSLWLFLKCNPDQLRKSPYQTSPLS